MALEQDINQAWTMNVDQLTELLGVTAMGTDGIGDALSSRSLLVSVADELNKDNAERLLFDSLKTKGKAFIDAVWEKSKEMVCYVYREKLKVDGDSDLVKYLAGIVVAAAKITMGIAILVVTVVIKMGLDSLCPIPAKQ